jgi:plasmid stabilization system protein ParE
MTNVILCSAAEDDFATSLCWYAERSAAAATIFDTEVEHALESIASSPQQYPMCDDRHRCFLMRRYPFQIIYRVIQGDVVVMAIAHSSRAPDFWSNR